MTPARRLAPALVAAGIFCVAAAAHADVPVGYKGTPFDPAVAGGKGVIPPGVKAGPYPIPGRLDLINYDLGGVGVAYDCIHHEVKGGVGYRTDVPTASLSLTAGSKMDVWYQASATLDGTRYPSATNEDFYVGALDATDWFNYTVDVKTAGTYSLGSTWATGNGPPGGMGGDGSMGVQISVNGTKMVDWKAAFPDYQSKANYHNWVPYSAFATLTLAAGLQVVKIQLTSNHFNLDYLDFTLVGADGGTSADAAAADGGATGTGGGAGAPSVDAGTQPSTGGGGSGGSGASGATGGTSSATGSGAAGGSSGGAGTSGAAGAPGAGPAKTATGGGCGLAGSPVTDGASWARVGLLLAAFGLSPRRRRRSNV
jgi:hypothetical protein